MFLTMATIAKDGAEQMFTALDGVVQKDADLGKRDFLASPA